jgi:hypothetical protein
VVVFHDHFDNIVFGQLEIWALSDQGEQETRRKWG